MGSKRNNGIPPGENWWLVPQSAEGNSKRFLALPDLTPLHLSPVPLLLQQY